MNQAKHDLIHWLSITVSAGVIIWNFKKFITIAVFDKYNRTLVI